ncbi:TMEM175 family protein [Devosia sp.]|uniref:TMEM175 family protein n=1 Tax=Devosia sp. TaxID=1871048 RepID=UPI003265BAD6
MGKTRLEAFSDGVLAIIITIMVLELKVPHSPTLEALAELLPVFLSYVLSFIFVGIYWNNHHHMLHTVTRVNGAILWANLHLLFWLSLIPFTAGWMGENHFETLPVALYGFVMMMAGIAYPILQQVIIASQGPHSKLKIAIGGDWKGRASGGIILVGIVTAFFNTWLACAIYAVIAVLWFIPDRRIEHNLVHEPAEE